MSVTVYFANVSKKRNSTYQGTFNVSYDCVLKAPTSLDRPTFLVSAATMDYNAAKYGDRYYLIDDVVSTRQDQWEVTCILDVLATYKADILASTQYVCYSSYKTSDWLMDNRIPMESLPAIHQEVGSLSDLLNTEGFYSLTVNGENGCIAYALSINDIKRLIAQVNTWKNDGITAIINGSAVPGITYDWSSPEDCIESLSKMVTQTGFIGNSYSNAPQMIRSCIWIPFKKSEFEIGNAENILLGNFDTGISAKQCKTTPKVGLTTISIPWQYSDWRRNACENIHLYLPFAGTITLSSDELASTTQLTVVYSATATDGVICYSLRGVNSHLIGTYGGSCCANYPIGINQQASAGAITQTVLSGVEKMSSIAINAKITPTSAAGVIASEALAGVQTAYDIQNVKHSTNPSCIGSFGGGAGAGLSFIPAITVVSYNTAADPSTMVSTMGYPTMKPMSLSGLTGFCQCANAHVAVAAQAREIDAIDTYLNTGFFIE